MGVWAYLIVILTALLLGSLAQYLARARLGYEWIVVGIGSGVAASVAGNAHLGGLGGWGPALDGLHVVPALLGAAVVAALLGAFLAVAVRSAAPS